jgi:hypothetical protein
MQSEFKEELIATIPFPVQETFTKLASFDESYS